MKKVNLFVCGVLASLAMGGALAQTKNQGGAINDHLGDYNYGVCRGTDPVCYHDWNRPKATEYRALLYTHTAGPRHANLGTPLPPGLNPPLADNNVVQKEMLKIAEEMGIKLDYTEDVSQMTRLTSYQAVIFFSTSRDNLDDSSKTALRQYIRAGGGFVGIHNAFGTLYNWPYYEGLLGNANFYDHGAFREGDVVVVNKKDVSTKELPARFHFKDEWYNLIPFPTNVRFLATVDEKSFNPAEERRGGEGGPPPGAGGPPGAGAGAGGPPGGGQRPGGPPGGGQQGPRLPSVVGSHPGHGSFHPVAWCQYYDGGKSWVTTLGHDANVFANDNSKFAGSVEFHKLIVGGIKSVMGMEPFCQG